MKLNLTGIIDIVFLLIIFLIIVYQRIDAQNFQIDVPENCAYADNDEHIKSPVTVSIFPNPSNGTILFAVGTEKCPFQPAAAGFENGSRPGDIINWLVSHINNEIDKKKLTVLRLRIDKTVKFRDSQLALAAAANSNVTDLEISAVKETINP